MRTRLRRYYPLLAIIAIALALRLPLLSGSFWLDEAAQALESARPWREQLHITDDFQPPLLHLLTHVSIQASTREWWLRLWGALIPGLLTIYATYLLGEKLAGRRAGALAATLLATSSFHIFYSQELRPYSLAAAAALWSWYFLLTHTQDQVNRNTVFSRGFLGFLLTSVLGIYSTYLYPFVFFSHLCYLGIRRRWRECGYAVGIVTLAFVPWLPSFLDQLHAGQTLRQVFPGWEQIVSFTFVRSVLLTIAKFLFGVVDIEVNAIFVSATLAIAFLLGFLFYHQRHTITREQKDDWLTLAIMLAVPFATASLVSLVVPVVQPKRVLFLLPFAYLAISLLVTTGKREKITRRFATTLVSLLLIINLAGTWAYYTQPALQRENWRHLLATLHHDYDSDDTVAVFSYQAPFSPWEWYERTNQTPFPVLATGTYDTGLLENLDILVPLSHYPHVIIFDYLRELTDREGKLLAYLDDHGYAPGPIYTYPNLGQVRVFTREATGEGEIYP